MYEKQVFKDGIRVLTESGDVSSRYFSSKETSELFKIGPVGRSLVMEKLQGIAGHTIHGLPEEAHEDEVSATDSLLYALGATRHDTPYSETKAAAVSPLR